MRDVAYYKFIAKYAEILLHVGKDIDAIASNDYSNDNNDEAWLSKRKTEYLLKLEDFINDNEIYMQYEEFIVEGLVKLGDIFYSQTNKFFILENNDKGKGKHYKRINKDILTNGELHDVINRNVDNIKWYSESIDKGYSFNSFFEDNGSNIEYDIDFYNALLLKELEEGYEALTNPSLMPDFYLNGASEYNKLLFNCVEKGVEYVVRNDSKDIICDEKKGESHSTYFVCKSTPSKENISTLKEEETSKSYINGICSRSVKLDKKTSKMVDKLMDDESKKDKFLKVFKKIWHFIILPFVFIYKGIRDFFKYKKWKGLFKKKNKTKKIKKEKIVKQKEIEVKNKKDKKIKVKKERKKFNFNFRLPVINFDITFLKDLLILIIPIILILLVPSGAFLAFIEFLLDMADKLMGVCYSGFFITKAIFSLPGFEGFLVIFSFLLKLVFGVIFAIVEFVLLIGSFILSLLTAIILYVLSLVIQFIIPILILAYLVYVIIKMVRKEYKLKQIIISLLVLVLLIVSCVIFFMLYKESVLANK
ncbi:MAG: hypothetical protein IKJ30_00490 [Bacilli bacterium]|nr:hypothetical protein [Bacilli bacterium]